MPSFPPKSDNLNVVLVGSFNPAIFHPEWFLRQEMIQPADVERAKVEVVSQDISRCQFAGLSLEVLQDHLTLQTQDLSKEAFLQDTIQMILVKLPHIPISACGLNSWHHYELGDEAYWHRIGHTLAPKEKLWNDLLTRPGMESLTIKGAREGDFPGHVSLTIQPSKIFKYGLFISANTHYGAIPKESPLSMEKLRDYIATLWPEAYSIARKTAAMIFDRIPKDV